MADDVKQFTVRIPAIYRTKVGNFPPALFEVREAQRKRLLEYRKKYGNYISPDQLD
jgi:phosphoenolpyruvate carboxykinase (GTP)